MININHDSTSTKPEKIELEVDLSKESYVSNNAGGSGILTFKNSKKENLEYIAAENHSYIRDKESGHRVTFSNAGYTGYKQELADLQKAARQYITAQRNLLNQRIDDNRDTTEAHDQPIDYFKSNYGPLVGKDEKSQLAYKQYKEAINKSNFSLQIDCNNSLEEGLTYDLFLNEINNIINKINVRITVANEIKNKELYDLNAKKETNPNYEEQRHELNNNQNSKLLNLLYAEEGAASNLRERFNKLHTRIVTQQTTGFSTMVIDGVSSDTSDLISSNKNNSFDTNTLTDYFEFVDKESVCNNQERNSNDAMTECMSEFSDKTQSSEVLYVITPFDNFNLPTIAMIH